MGGKEIMEVRTRGKKPNTLGQKDQLDFTAEKVALLLAQSKTTFNDVDEVFRKVKSKLKVTY